MPETPFSFVCPYCNRPTTIQANDYDRTFFAVDPSGKDTGKVGYTAESIICPNPECKKTTATIRQFNIVLNSTGSWVLQKQLRRWNLMPRSQARQYPDYVPQAIREDYEEAHLILEDSPKASATLARRALQGIMRDFFSAKPGNLKDEIDAVEASGKMDAGLTRAVHAVRDVGNIGAHMEKDISVIVPVDPGEADALLKLIEVLLDETYVARQDREDRVNAVLQIAAAKKAAKAPPGP
jgi:hypothetical protein